MEPESYPPKTESRSYAYLGPAQQFHYKLAPVLKKHILAASSNALKILNNVSDLIISYEQLQKIHKCTLPMNMMKYTLSIQLYKTYNRCNGWKVWSNGTTCMPKSIPRYVVDKVRFVCSDLRYSAPMSMSEIKVPNKSLSHELNNVLFCRCCCCTDKQM